MIPDNQYGITFAIIIEPEEKVEITFPGGWVQYCDPLDTEFMNDIIHSAARQESIRRQKLDYADQVYPDGCTMNEFMDL